MRIKGKELFEKSYIWATMKKIIPILIFLLISFNMEAKEIKGQVIMQKETLDVVLLIPVKMFSSKLNYLSLQAGVSYIDKKGNKKTFSPDEVQEYSFTYNGENIRMVATASSIRRALSLSDTNIFLKLMIDGDVKLFNYYYTYTIGSPGIPVFDEKFILQKGIEDIKELKKLSQRELVDFFGDCYELSRKIEDDKLGKDQIETIVKEYNTNCMKKD